MSLNVKAKNNHMDGVFRASRAVAMSRSQIDEIYELAARIALYPSSFASVSAE